MPFGNCAVQERAPGPGRYRRFWGSERYRSGNHGHHFHDFRDLFLVQFSRKTLPEIRYFLSFCLRTGSPTGIGSSEAINKSDPPAMSAKTPPGYPVSHPPIRTRYGPRLTIMRIIFSHNVQKTVHFYTLFPETHFPHDSSQTERFPSNYKTLLYAFGRQNRRGLDR